MNTEPKIPYSQRSEIGQQGEDAACEYLVSKGYKILCRNFHSRFGEIDIIASCGRYIVFDEVKARGDTKIARPAEFVEFSKQKKIEKTAQYYLMKNRTDLQPRFDVTEIYLGAGGMTEKIIHMENAWEVN